MTMADPTPGASPWVVLKFGGTSVSSVANWKNIAAVLRDRLAEGLRPVVVHSALSGITDRLEAEPDYRDQPGQQPGGHGDDAFNHVVGQVNCASRRPGG